MSLAATDILITHTHTVYVIEKNISNRMINELDDVQDDSLYPYSNVRERDTRALFARAISNVMAKKCLQIDFSR